MRQYCTILVALLGLTALTHALQQITPQQLDDLARRYDSIVVFLHSNQEDTRAQTERLIGELDGLQAKFDGVMPDQIAFVSINVETHPDVVQRLPITMVPAIHLIREGRSREYMGQRMAVVFGEWLQRLYTSPAVRSLDTKTQRKVYQDEHRESVHVIGYFDPDQTALLEAFARAARHFQNDIDFFLVSRADAAKSLKIKQVNSLVVHRPAEKPEVLSELSGDFDSLARLILAHSQPLYHEFSMFNVFRVFSGTKPKVVAAVTESREQSGAVLSAFKAAAKAMQQEFDFVLFPGELYAAFLPLIGLEATQVPTLVVLGQQGQERVWSADRELSNKAVLTWLRQWLADHPRAPEPRAVADLDTSALNGLLQGTAQQHVFVEFYATGCEPCQAVAPLWTQFAAQSTGAGEHSLLIGAFDLDQGLPVEAQLNVSVLPSFVYWAAHNSTPVYYHGAHTVEAWTQFVAQQRYVHAASAAH